MVQMPPVLHYILTHNSTMNGELITIYLSNTTYTIPGVCQMGCYTILISAVNVIGKGPVTSRTICKFEINQNNSINSNKQKL